HHESHRCAGRIAVVLDARLRLSPRPQDATRICGDARSGHDRVRQELAAGMSQSISNATPMMRVVSGSNFWSPRNGVIGIFTRSEMSPLNRSPIFTMTSEC